MKSKDLKKVPKAQKASEDLKNDGRSKKEIPSSLFLDNRQDAIQQVQLKKMVEDSHVTQQAHVYQDQAINSPFTTAQLKKKEDYFGTGSSNEEIANRTKIRKFAFELDLLGKSQQELNIVLGQYGNQESLIESRLGIILLSLGRFEDFEAKNEEEEDILLEHANLSETVKVFEPLMSRITACSQNLKFINATYQAEKEIYDEMPRDFDRAISNSSTLSTLLNRLKFSEPEDQRRLKLLQTEIQKLLIWLQQIRSEISGDKSGKTFARKLSAKNSKR